MQILTKEELAVAQSIIDRTPTGVYELRDIYGPEWQNIASPTSFGARFKKTVGGRHLKRIRPSSQKKKTNNHHTYEIHS